MYTCVPKITIIWHTVPEIRSETDILFCHFGPLFALLPPYGPKKSKFWKNEKNARRYYHFTHVYQKWQSYDVWFPRHGVQQTEFFVILDNFLPFYLPNNLKNQNFEKIKNMPQDIIILHRCKINDNHMIYGSWDTECDGENFLSFWTIFYTFTTPTHPKNPNFEKMKKNPWDIVILHVCTINDNHMVYGSWDMECNRENFLSFWTVFCPYTTLTTQNNPKNQIFCHFGQFFALIQP